MGRNWAVGFAGAGEIAKEQVEPLLDDWFNKADADGVDVVGFIPDRVSRTNKAMMQVWSLFDEWHMDYTKVPEHEVVARLQYQHIENGLDATLVILGESEETTVLARQAIALGITVKDMAAGLYDVEYEAEDEPEAPLDGVLHMPCDEFEMVKQVQEIMDPLLHGMQTAEPRTYGQPREPEAVQAEVEGPATLVSQISSVLPPGELLQEIGLPVAVVEDIHQHGLLSAAVRQIIRDEVSRMGWTSGHNAHMEVPEQDEAVRAFVDGDGKYELAPKESKKAPRGKKTVQISRKEAEEIGIL